MINAVLVFNNNGQPRLTKFYTQLVSRYPAALALALTRRRTPLTPGTGHTNPAIPDRANIPSSRAASSKRLQLPPTPSSPLARRQLHRLRALRYPHPNHIPDLRDAVVHYDLYVDRVPTRSD